MYVIVSGAGSLGSALAASLVAAGHEVFVIDPDAALLARAQEDLGSVGRAGYASSVAVLTEAGAARAQIFVAVTPSDEENLAACQLAKRVLQTPRTVALANQPDNVRLFETVGVDAVVSKIDVLIANLAGSLPAHPLLKLMPVAAGSREVVGIKIPALSVAVGRAVREISLPYGSMVILVVSADGKVQTGQPDTVLQAEDEVIAVAPADAAETLWEALTELR
ncbi:MAG: TrkA family potassium uptake protein [Dehalococcoidia bacterium]|nr:TrkA family potassium uptake protein [Dehalococcoidia bacterium]MSQ34327.1 TrkA family potassium uptake protein [Dehalococcoidia bacterium]